MTIKNGTNKMKAEEEPTEENSSWRVKENSRGKWNRSGSY